MTTGFAYSQTFVRILSERTEFKSGKTRMITATTSPVSQPRRARPNNGSN